MLGNENQVMEFNTNEDGSITGEFTLRLRARKEVLRVLPIGEQVKSNKKIERIWERNGKKLDYNIVDMGKLDDLDEEGYQTIVYSVTIRAKTE